MSSSSTPVAVVVYYSGRVQGVGFRATAESIARRHPVTGTVRNRADGRVELTAEGTRAALEAFLAAVRSYFDRHITSESADWQAATGQYTTFEITG